MVLNEWLNPYKWNSTANWGHGRKNKHNDTNFEMWLVTYLMCVIIKEIDCNERILFLIKYSSTVQYSKMYISIHPFLKLELRVPWNRLNYWTIKHFFKWNFVSTRLHQPFNPLRSTRKSKEFYFLLFFRQVKHNYKHRLWHLNRWHHIVCSLRI